jgi:uncharacterized protein (TIGR02117 family)
MIKKVLKYIGVVFLSLVGFVIVYLIAAFILSRIAVPAVEADDKKIAIYIKTNGVHTDIVVPTKNEWKDWSEEIKFAHTLAKDTAFQYLGMGWGDKGFYLETPTWAELKPSVAFKAATGLSTAAVHATYYYEMQEDSSSRKILVTPLQYRKLVAYITNSFLKDISGKVIHIKTNANYGETDAFYDAIGSYHMFHTCNTWANNALKACGQKASLWTPFDTGIFYHYR